MPPSAAISESLFGVDGEIWPGPQLMAVSQF